MFFILYILYKNHHTHTLLIHSGQWNPQIIQETSYLTKSVVEMGYVKQNFNLFGAQIIFFSVEKMLTL